MDGWKTLATLAPLARNREYLRLLLWGKQPGTGKSSWAEREYPGECERVTIHREMMPEDLLFVRELRERNGATVTETVDGPALRAMRQGRVLVLDEIDQLGGALRCLLHAICDDPGMAGVTLPTGERVKPENGFCVIATSNAAPSELPEALASRFLAVQINRPQDVAIAQLGQLRELAANHYARENPQEVPFVFHFRAAAQCVQLARLMPMERACEIVFGPHARQVLDSIAALATGGEK